MNSEYQTLPPSRPSNMWEIIALQAIHLEFEDLDLDLWLKG